MWLVAIVLTGCGGIHAGHSISPASFLLPGIIQATPQTAPADHTIPTSAPEHPVASVN